MVGISLGSGKKTSTTTNDQQQSDNRAVVSDDAFLSINNIDGSNNVVTDSGAIRGNVEIANQALLTADTITERIGEQSLNALDRVAKLATDFGGSVESIKKTELTGGTSLIFDNLKFWPIIPIVFVLIALISKPSKGGS